MIATLSRRAWLVRRVTRARYRAAGTHAAENAFTNGQFTHGVFGIIPDEYQHLIYQRRR